MPQMFMRPRGREHSMTTITILRPAKVQAPRAAAWAARAFLTLLAWFEKSADQRAQRALVITRASEAAAVRAYADEVQALDPRFAADLRAAADRHEYPA
jgi:hypothetical protein